MLPDSQVIYTHQGWKHIQDCYVGQKIMSYNYAKNCLEDDTILNITSEYKQMGLLGYKTFNTNVLMSANHAIILINNRKKTVETARIKDLHMRNISTDTKILKSAKYNPFCYTKNLDDVEWSARLAASYSRVKYLPKEAKDQIVDIVSDCSAGEAKTWLNAFYHWHTLQRAPSWQYSVVLTNRSITPLIEDLGIRSGHPALLYKPTTFGKAKTLPHRMGISTGRDITVDTKAGWSLGRHEGIMYNISTKNKTFVTKNYGSASIISCEEK